MTEPVEPPKKYKPVFSILEGAKQVNCLWYKPITQDFKSFLEIIEPITIQAIKLKIFDSNPSFFKEGHGVNYWQQLVIKINKGQVLPDNWVVLKETVSELCDIEHPITVAWSNYEIEKKIEEDKAEVTRLKQDLGLTSFEAVALYHDAGFDEVLIKAFGFDELTKFRSEPQKFKDYINDADIASRAVEFKNFMKNFVVGARNEADCTALISILLSFAIRTGKKEEPGHIGHTVVINEYPLKIKVDSLALEARADMVVYDEVEQVVLIVTEAKHNNMTDAMKQNLQQLRMQSYISKKKRAFGIATTYFQWVILYYNAEDGVEKVCASHYTDIGKHRNEDLDKLESLFKLLRVVLCFSFENNGIISL